MNETIDTLYVQLSDNSAARLEILRRIQEKCAEEMVRLDQPIEKKPVAKKGDVSWLLYADDIVTLFQKEGRALSKQQIRAGLRRQWCPESTLSRNLAEMVKRHWLQKVGYGVYVLA